MAGVPQRLSLGCPPTTIKRTINSKNRKAEPTAMGNEKHRWSLVRSE